MLNLLGKLQHYKSVKSYPREARNFFSFQNCAMRNHWGNFCKLRFFVEELDIVIESEKYILPCVYEVSLCKRLYHSNLID